MRKLIFLFVAPLVLSLAGCSSLSTPAPTSAIPSVTGAAHPSVIATKRVIYYYQTQYSNGLYVSLSPILHTLNPNTGKPWVTDVLVAAFHLGYDSNNAPYIHLNDNPPGDPMFDVMWPQVAKTMYLRMEFMKILFGHLRARVALAAGARARGEVRARHVAAAAGLARQVAKQPSSWGRATAMLIEASVARFVARRCPVRPNQGQDHNASG